MSSIRELTEKYKTLDSELIPQSNEAIDPSCLLVFDYEYPGNTAEVVIDTEVFTALCPWTNLPDFGAVNICYVPDHSCIELKSLKYYLLSYRSVGIVQEHAANRILMDLVAVCQPVHMTVELDYQVRGGLHTSVTVRYEKP